MLITPTYAALNADLHISNPGYGASSGKWYSDVVRVIQETGAKSVLDYGCGKGHLFKMLQNHLSGISAMGYDPAIQKFSTLPEPADLVVCTDVLEHVEPEHLDAVLQHLRGLSKKAFCCYVATRVGNKKLGDGRNAHLIVQEDAWWENKLRAVFPTIGHKTTKKLKRRIFYWEAL